MSKVAKYNNDYQANGLKWGWNGVDNKLCFNWGPNAEGCQIISAFNDYKGHSWLDSYYHTARIAVYDQETNKFGTVTKYANNINISLDDDYCVPPTTSFVIETGVICKPGSGLLCICFRKFKYDTLPRNVTAIQYFNNNDNWVDMTVNSAIMYHAYPSEYNSLSTIVVSNVFWDISLDNKIISVRIYVAAK